MYRTGRQFIDAAKKRAKRLGLSMEEVTRRAGIARINPGRWSRGESEPSMESQRRVNDVLDREERRQAKEKAKTT